MVFLFVVFMLDITGIFKISSLMSISRTKNIAKVDNVIKEYLLQFHFNLKKNNLKETIKLLMIVFSINQSEFLQMKQ